MAPADPPPAGHSAARFVQKTAHTHPRPAPEAVAKTGKAPVALVLEDIRSGGNVGAVLRSADAFGIGEVILVGYTPAPPHREILKTSLGAERSVRWRRADSLTDVVVGFRASGYRITALEQTTHSTPLRDYRPEAHPGTVVILGNEVRGVSAAALSLCDEVLEIPQVGAKQSLNVAVAAGILAYSLTARSGR